jgi:hypothetical protein
LRLLLELQHALPNLLFREVRGFAELEIVVAIGDTEQGLGFSLQDRAPQEATDGFGDAAPESVDHPHAPPDGGLIARELDGAAGQKLHRHLQRVLVAIGVNQELVGLDGAGQLLARLLADASDVAGGREIDARVHSGNGTSGRGFRLRSRPGGRPRGWF